MIDDNSPYTPEQKKSAVRAYLITGVCVDAGKLCDIPGQTINHWKLHAPWWDEVANEVCMELEEKYRAGWRGVLSGALDVMQDRLEHGNYVVDRNGQFAVNAEGNKVRVPIAARDAIVIAGIAQDKLRLSLGLPSRIVSRESQEDRFARFRAAATADQTSRAPKDDPSTQKH